MAVDDVAGIHTLDVDADVYFFVFNGAVGS